MSKNVYTVDNSDLDGTTTVIPRDLDGEDDALETGTKHKREVLIKIVNNTGQTFDATPAATSGDDHSFQEYVLADNETETVSTGSAPDNVEGFRNEFSFPYHGVELSNFAADPTSGDLKITIESRTYS